MRAECVPQRGAGVLEPRPEAVPLPSAAGRRLTLLLPRLLPGGAERVQLELARQFRDCGADVELLVMEGGGALQAAVPDGVRLKSLEAPRIRQLAAPLARHLAASRPDALLAALWPLTSVAVVARRLAGVPMRLVLSEHGFLDRADEHRGRWRRLMLTRSMALTYPHADARVAVSAALAAALARMSGMAVGDFDVIPNPVAPWAVVPGAADPWAGAAGKRLLAVGTLRPVKNHALLLRAFARLVQAAPATPVTLAILGEGAERPRLEELARSLGIADRVRMPGFVAEPGRWFAGADLFISASDHEGLGNAIVEALAAGVAVVATEAGGGPAEILEGGRHGVLVPCGDETALAAAIGEALTRRPDAAALRARAADYAPPRAAARYLRLLLPDLSAAATP